MCVGCLKATALLCLFASPCKSLSAFVILCVGGCVGDSTSHVQSCDKRRSVTDSGRS
jgi:hypothetical protein